MNQESNRQAPTSHQSAAGGYTPSLPSLPVGYTAQPCGSFCESCGLLQYEFHRVYRPIERLLDQVVTTLAGLDEELSFWAVTWGRQHESGDLLPAGRWISYGQTRRLKNSHLTFEQFLQRRQEVPALLHVQDIMSEPRWDGSTRFKPDTTQGDAWSAKLKWQLIGEVVQVAPRHAHGLAGSG
jgi:hypothetical protein